MKRILDDAFRQSKAILEHHRAQLDLIAGELLKMETMDTATFRRLLESLPAD